VQEPPERLTRLKGLFLAESFRLPPTSVRLVGCAAQSAWFCLLLY
jgi:hypothetical protein